MQRNLMLKITLCLLALAATLSMPCAQAATKPASSAWDSKVSLDLKDASLASTIESLLKDKGINYSIDPDLGKVQIPKLTITDISLRQALQSILKVSGAVQRTDKGTVVIEPGEVWSRKISVNFKNKPFHDVLAELFKQVGVPDWTVDSDVLNYECDFDTTSPVKNTPPSFIEMLAAMEKGMAIKFGYGFVSAGDPWQRVINMELKDMPLPDAIDALLKDTGISYSIEPNAQQLKVTAVLKSIPLDSAFKGVMKAAGAVYRVENNVYRIALRPVFSTTMENTYGDSVVGLSVNEVVSLKYVNAGDIASLVKTGHSQLSVSATDGNKLFLSGPAVEVDDARALIAKLDDESALSKTIRLKLAVKIITTTSKGRKTYEQSTESIGAEGMPAILHLQILTPYYTSHSTVATNGKVIKQTTPNFITTPLQATVVPTLEADGRIGLTGKGIFEFAFLSPGMSIPAQIQKSFYVAASEVAGKPTTIAAGTATLDTGKAEFTVTMTATPEQGRVRVPSQPETPSVGYGMGGSYGGYPSSRNYGGSYGQSYSGGGYPGMNNNYVGGGMNSNGGGNVTPTQPKQEPAKPAEKPDTQNK